MLWEKSDFSNDISELFDSDTDILWLKIYRITHGVTMDACFMDSRIYLS